MPLIIDIPEKERLRLEHLVLDFNGTLATDGQLLPGTVPLLIRLSKVLKVHVLTADTFGTVREQMKDVPVVITILEKSGQAEQKERYIQSLGAENTVAVGNGNNDKLMLRKAKLGIAVILEEGASVAAIQAAQLVCTGITDVLNLLLHPKRIVAGLR